MIFTKLEQIPDSTGSKYCSRCIPTRSNSSKKSFRNFALLASLSSSKNSISKIKFNFFWADPNNKIQLRLLRNYWIFCQFSNKNSSFWLVSQLKSKMIIMLESRRRHKRYPICVGYDVSMVFFEYYVTDDSYRDS